MKEKYNNKGTDRAWQKLHSRLEQDGLLQTQVSRKKSFPTSPDLKWAVAVAVVCLSAIIVSMVFKNRTSDNNLLSLYNDKDAVTLVKTLEDGSIVYLSERTSLHFPSHFEADKREVFLEGNALFDVSGNKESPFLIDAGDVSIEVLGTKFNVKNKDAANFSLSVERGQVKISLKESGESILVKSGQTGLVRAGQLQTVSTSDTDQFLDYTRHIQFKDERLGDIIRVVNRNSQQIALDIAPSLAERRLTVTFSDDSPQAMAQLICMALRLQYVQQDNKILISEIK